MNNIHKAFEEFATAIPDHECIGEGCEFGEGFYYMVFQEQGRDSATTNTLLHSVSVDQIILAFIRLVDEVSQRNDDGAPEMVKFARGRDAIRRAVETQAPPPDVNMGLGDLLSNFLKAFQNEEDEGE